jgi:hypothetical protein
LLAAARDTIREVPFFWIITGTGEGDANARVVNAQSGGEHEEFWVRWFLTPEPAELIDDRGEVSNPFRSSQFNDPEGRVAASLNGVRVVAERIELHLRGVTAEPWGRGRTTLERDPAVDGDY